MNTYVQAQWVLAQNAVESCIREGFKAVEGMTSNSMLALSSVIHSKLRDQIQMEVLGQCSTPRLSVDDEDTLWVEVHFAPFQLLNPQRVRLPIPLTAPAAVAAREEIWRNQHPDIPSR